MNNKTGYQTRLPADITPLLRQGCPPRLLRLAAELAERRGSTARDELFALPRFDRADYWRGIAEDLGIGFVERVDGLAVDPRLGYVPPAALRRASRVMVVDRARSLLLLAPEADEIERLRSHCRARPELAAYPHRTAGGYPHPAVSQVPPSLCPGRRVPPGAGNAAALVSISLRRGRS